MKNYLKVLTPVFFLALLSACAGLFSEPTPTDVPTPTETSLPTPLPTVNPEWPEEAKVIAEFYKAWSEDRGDDALSYLSEDVRLHIGGICFSGNSARVLTKDHIEDPTQKSVIVVLHYQIDGDMVDIYYKEFSPDGSVREAGSGSYFVSDGLIQWQAPCQPDD